MIKPYIQLFRLKPIGLILAMVLFAHLYALSETGLTFEWGAVVVLLGTTGLANAAAFALNQYYERDADAKMERTQNRPIPAGQIAPSIALVLGLTLFGTALLLQVVFINLATAQVTFLCGGIYVWSYTPLKSRSNMSTLVGSLPGAILPLIGWFSVTEGLNLMILWMSVMIFLWQIPHTFVICFRYKDEYKKAGGKQLPFVAGENAAFRQSVWYTVINIPLILTPVVFKVSGEVYLGIAFVFTLLAIVFVVLFSKHRNNKWARQFFFYMLSYLPVLFIAMALDRI